MSDRPLISPGAEELAILAHEVRSPVAALRALSEAASGADVPLLRRLAGLAGAAITDIVRLCGNGDPITLGPLAPVPLSELITGSERADVSVTGAATGVILADGTRLRQALANVVANGLRHGSQVTVSAHEVGAGRVAIEVRDDGPGVPEGLDVFAKGVSGASSTGYGLWVARQIVEAHGGVLELVRDGAPGACFRIELPLASASA